MSFSRFFYSWIPFLIIFIILQTCAIVFYFNQNTIIANEFSLASFPYALTFVLCKKTDLNKFNFNFILLTSIDLLSIVIIIAHVQNNDINKLNYLFILAYVAYPAILLITKKGKFRFNSKEGVGFFTDVNYMGLLLGIWMILFMLLILFVKSPAFNESLRYLWIITTLISVVGIIEKDKMQWLHKLLI